VSLILNIDTGTQTSSVCLAKNGIPLSIRINPSQKESAAWLHFAIKELLKNENLDLQQLNAVSVTEGPGSYTGLRVGMATAKGLCYALKKPLITINTLHLMAYTASKMYTHFLCPMIDARRMEVFTAVFDHDLNLKLGPTNLILSENSFNEILEGNHVVFFGSGSLKFQPIMKHPHGLFASIEVNASSMAPLSYKKSLKREVVNLAYTQPFYGKDFHSQSN
jgi:tRNA threonylcarbamoyladenosine biosynthesis protein TsaB